MTRIYLGVGTNTRREHHLHRGLDALEQLLGPLQLSPVFESDAVGILGARFYNLVVAADTPLPLADLNAALKRSEEHTSELQSRPHLVCRLLLAKKNDDTRALLYATED